MWVVRIAEAGIVFHNIDGFRGRRHKLSGCRGIGQADRECLVTGYQAVVDDRHRKGIGANTIAKDHRAAHRWNIIYPGDTRAVRRRILH